MRKKNKSSWLRLGIALNDKKSPLLYFSLAVNKVLWRHSAGHSAASVAQLLHNQRRAVTLRRKESRGSQTVWFIIKYCLLNFF